MSRARSLAAAVLAGLAAALPHPGNADEGEFRAQREALVRYLEAYSKAAEESAGIPRPSARVLAAIAQVPRHDFLPAPLRPLAYLDRPLPLGHGQNIAQPYLIALMTELARVGADDVVYETGTGAGYHAAVLSLLAKHVYSVEIVEPLAFTAAATLRRLGYDNVTVQPGDGYYGLPEHGPYDVVIIKEAVDHVPGSLLRQLRPGGRMVLPLGPLNGLQYLTVVEKDAAGAVTERRILPVRFSPFQGGERI